MLRFQCCFYLLVICTIDLSSTTLAKSINVSFGITLDDANTVDSGEIAIHGIPGAESVDGSKWNNLNLRTSGAGTPTTFTEATQGSNHIDLMGSSGADSGIDLVSSGSFYSNFSNASSPNQAGTGDAGLLQSYINLNSSETITLSGLSTWAPFGYKVYAVFDIGSVARTYAVTMTDGSTSQEFWTNDTASTDSDSNNDGVIEWLPTTSNTSKSAITDANYAIYGTLTGDTLTISGDATSGRATLCGFQIVAHTEAPATINTFTATPDPFSEGQTVTLNWDVSDADSISIDQGVGTVTSIGSAVTTPTSTSTWTLTATRGNSTITSQASATLTKGTIDVYLLGGQSNMQGIARSSKLPSELLSIPEVQLYAAGSGVSGSLSNQWVALQPANGSTFGPEIGFGERLRDLCRGRDIAFIKYAGSGTSLEIGWKPGVNATDTGNWGGQFTNFVNTVNNGIAALEADGWQPVIKGMVWQQGEQDAKDGLNVSESNTSADDYGANLSAFIGRVREQFASHASHNGIRFVSGQVLPYAPAGGDVTTRFPGRDLVRQAILNSAENSGAPLAVTNAAAVETNSTAHPTHEQELDGHRDTDEVHLNAAAQLALGRAMAYQMLNLTPQSYIDWSTNHGLVGGENADDDSDGSSNLMEFFFGYHPLDATSVFRATPAVIETISGSDYLTLTHPRNLNALAVTATIQYSEDLENWNTVASPVFLESSPPTNGSSILKYRAPYPLGDSPHRSFMRLLVTP